MLYITVRCCVHVLARSSRLENELSFVASALDDRSLRYCDLIENNTDSMTMHGLN